MPELTPAEFFGFLLPIACLGIYAIREEIGTRRWDPEFFRHGFCVFRKSVPLAAWPPEVPSPRFESGWFFSRKRSKRLGPREVAFLVPTLNSPVMRGLLRYNEESRSLEVVGHLHIGIVALFGFGFAAGGFTLALPMLALLVVWGYWGERESFRQVLEERARRV